MLHNVDPYSIRSSEDTADTTVVLEDLGSLLQQEGHVTLTKENVLVSVFKKVDIPKIPVPRCNSTCGYTRACVSCKRRWTCKSNGAEAAYLEEMIHLKEMAQHHIEDYLDVRTAFLQSASPGTPPNAVNRKKRFAGLIAAGMALFSTVFTGISTATLSHHINIQQIRCPICKIPRGGYRHPNRHSRNPRRSNPHVR